MLIGERYRLLNLVGRGGMGRVWVARDELLDRDVAVKEIHPPGFLGDDEQDDLAARMIREARIAARLNHPNVVSVHDVVSHEGSPWIVMEYVPSKSLQEVLRAGPVEPRRAAEIGLAVLTALTAAHRANVLHRDVKPGNVLIADDGRIMLTDFGLATIEDGTDGLTRTGMILGSAEYVAPERAAEGVSTVATDLWSLGATLHAAVEGKSPYARSTAMATLTALATAPPDPAPHAGPLEPVLAGLLRRDPRRRLAALEVERMLRAAIGGAVTDARAAEVGRRVRALLDQTAAQAAGAIPGATGSPVGLQVRPDGSSTPPSWADLGRPTETGGGDTTGPAPDTDGRGPIEISDDDPVASRRPHHRRSIWRWWIPLLAAVLAILASVGTILVITLDGNDTPEDRATAPMWTPEPGDAGPDGADRPPPPHGRKPPPPFACLRPGQSERTVATTQPPFGDTFDPPGGWTWHFDAAGFQLAVPVGWRYFREGSVACFQDPRSSQALSVDPAVSLTIDPVSHFRAEEQRAIGDGTLPDYQRIGLTARRDRAEWELRWTAPHGERMRSVRMLYGRPGKRAYAVGWVAPDDLWTDVEPDVLRASFRS
ncbi:protein kinase [Plantactinospora sp. GCM10030261]|uniref:protein kinase domain-containing protein n=1 Tax=Plantactinospora sp. GCM10030261 TaxID=3273420 RepID=UPI00360AC53E